MLLADDLNVKADKSGRPILYLVKEYLNKKIPNRTAFLNVFAPRVFAGLALADASGYYIPALELVKRHLCTWRPKAPHAAIIDTVLKQQAEVMEKLVNGETIDAPAVLG